MADRPTSDSRAPGVKSPGARLPWPRTPDETATFTSLSTTGQNVEPRCGGYGLYLVAGVFSGAQALAAGNNWFDIFPGDVLPAGTELRSDGSFTGRLSMRWYAAENDDLAELERLAQLMRGSGPSVGSAPSSLPPNRSTATRATVAGGVINHVWSQAGFQYAILHALPGNAADIIIGGAFVLAAGASLNEFVSTATGFAATGTNGDIIDILEFGRV